LGCCPEGTDEPIVGGTAFFVWTPPADGELFPETFAPQVVTARHCIEGVQRDYPGTPVTLFLNHETLGLFQLDTDPDDWIGHPTEPEVEVAVLKYPIILSGFDHSAAPRSSLVTPDFLAEYQVGIGDDLLFPGLFRFHSGTEKIRPVLRQGTIAAMPNEKVKVGDGRWISEAYLAEARSIGGLSGSPVVLHLDLWRVTPEPPVDGVELEPGPDKLLGMMIGHWDSPMPSTVDSLRREAVNMGIAIVIPANRITETIDQPGASRVIFKS
jgi:hypothetical protein